MPMVDTENLATQAAGKYRTNRGPGIDFLQEQIRRAMVPGGQPGIRQRTVDQAFQEQEAKLRGMSAGMGGPQGAIAMQRAMQASPLMAAKRAQQSRIAAGEDEEAMRRMALQAIQEQRARDQGGKEEDSSNPVADVAKIAARAAAAYYTGGASEAALATQ